MLGTIPQIGTKMGYAVDYPTDAEYIVTGYIREGENVLPVGAKLPMSSSLRQKEVLLEREVRVGRLQLAPVRQAKTEATPVKPIPSTSKTKSRR